MRFLILIVALLAASQAMAEPRAKTVELHKRTNITVFVPPDLGARFSFPFILDEQDSYVPFTMDITNSLFIPAREKGRNYFVITPKVGSPSGMLGNVFITVAGFEITVELRTTNDLAKHYSDIVFELTQEAREQLIQQKIAQRTKALEQEYATKFAALDEIAEKKAVALVGRLAITEPRTRSIKEEAVLKMPSGDKALLYVDQAVEYSTYSIYLFDLEADSGSKGMSILDARLFGVDAATKEQHPIDGFKTVPERVQPGNIGKGSLTVQTSSLVPGEILRLQVVTDKGVLEAEW